MIRQNLIIGIFIAAVVTLLMLYIMIGMWQAQTTVTSVDTDVSEDEELDNIFTTEERAQILEALNQPASEELSEEFELEIVGSLTQPSADDFTEEEQGRIIDELTQS